MDVIRIKIQILVRWFTNLNCKSRLHGLATSLRRRRSAGSRNASVWSKIGSVQAMARPPPYKWIVNALRLAAHGKLLNLRGDGKLNAESFFSQQWLKQILTTRSIWKMLSPSPLRAAACPFTRCRYCTPPLSHADCASMSTTTTTTTRDRGDRYGPIEWAQLER